MRQDDVILNRLMMAGRGKKEKKNLQNYGNQFLAEALDKATTLLFENERKETVKNS